MLRISRNLNLLKYLRKSILNGCEKHKGLNRYLSTQVTDSSTKDEPKFKTFEELIDFRSNQAKKSLLIQVNSEKSYPELANYCSQFGEIETAYHYTVTNDVLHFILLEFKEQSGFDEAFQNCSFDMQSSNSIPVASPFLWFKAEGTKKSLKTASTSNVPNLRPEVVKVIDDDSLYELLTSVETLNDQILILNGATKLNELGMRIRFMAARQFEMALNGLFPYIHVYPFGSSVNGFGRMGSDLDLILRLNDDRPKQLTKSRLIFHTKASQQNDRSRTQKQMDLIGDIMHSLLPAINNVRKILLARVPIIKYNHECLDLDIDFSMSNMTGFYMSELLYLYGELDERVRPLVCCIRKWAASCGLTNSKSPGPWITNFSLTVMVLFFLQNLQNPILPSLMSLIKSALPSDIRVTDDNVNCTFLRDLNKIEFQTTNNDSLQILLLQFFEFYSKFNFQQNGISLNDAKPILKKDNCAIWITNPLEPDLNVSRNVSFEELEKFRMEARDAAWTLESTIDKQKDPTWGVLNLLKGRKRQVKPEMFFKSRLINVTDIFEEEDKRNSNNVKNYDNIQYKNSSIKSAVKNIQNATQRNILNLRKNS
ncbi:hypothetical protein PVAND_012994 [Polypedilum vanderplanki]|uniref:Poly(A) RNA polymerase n=1 Tax=Polypedilum vanderplanki TaxID=319348 RepID=A0A9J6CNB7_POLVA|nr:hypothetical protein PVAND_012994 [Polypedilum vanderplanki]